MHTQNGLAALLLTFVCGVAPPALANEPADPSKKDDGPVHVQAFDLPQSAYLSEETRAVLRQHHALWAAAFNDSCGSLQGAKRERLAEIRECQAAAFYASEIYRQVRDRYPVSITSQRIGGVYSEIFTPSPGISGRNQKRVLINLHGGGFLEGSRTVAHLESIPIAGVARIKVISIDYRQAPEARFPAASEDVAAVYRELLKSYAPKNIGIYGCSAGGLLTAQTVAWLQKEHLPLPGAVGMFCMGATYTGKGDSAFIARAIEGAPADEFAKYFAYFEGTQPDDPLVYPVLSQKVLQVFPPSLLVTATRDHAMSSAVYTHSRLSQLGVETELHVFEGLGHAFFYDPALPESREVYSLVSKFFDAHLGTQ
jgi:monoterpene epsilon-lactone hydrolase